MIVHVEVGSSFKGAGLYLLHDAREDGDTRPRLTDERVDWTHALNTLENQPEHVIREMQVTCFNQPMLKMMSGNRVDGRPTEKPVMHVSLSWALDQKQPTQADMIAAGRRYLDDHGWGDLQCLMVAHNDKEYKHVHLLINRVHPETGMSADQSYREHNALQWARRYDAEQGYFLEQREAKHARGEKIAGDMTRAEWEAWKAAGGTRRPHADRDAALRAGEWDALKSAQQDERRAFFKESANLRGDLRDAVREAVKAEFADQWSDYAAHRDGLAMQQNARDLETRRAIGHLRRHSHGASSDGVKRLQEAQAGQYAEMKAELAALRAPIIEAQKARTTALATPALAELAKERAAAYEALKATHRDDKKELRDDQAAGERRPDLLTRQHEAGERLEAARNAPKLIETAQAPASTPQPVHRYHGTPKPAFGVSRNEAVRRQHENGSSPTPRPATPAAERTAADKLPNAAKEVTASAPALDVGDIMARRAAARAEAREERQAHKDDPSGRIQRKESQPKTDRQAIIEAARAQSRERQADRGRGDDDGGRGRDR